MDLDAIATRHKGDDILEGGVHLGAEIDARQRAVAVAIRLAGLRMKQTPLLLITPTARFGTDDRSQKLIAFIIAGLLNQHIDRIDRRRLLEVDDLQRPAEGWQ